jgi:hypothetical protein
VRSARIVLLLALTTALGCSSPLDPSSELASAESALLKQWFWSYEESGEVLVYREAGFPFAPSMGRPGFTVHRSGRFVWHEIAPACGIVDVEASWQYERDRPARLVVQNRDNQRVRRIVLHEVSEGVLRVTIEL